MDIALDLTTHDIYIDGPGDLATVDEAPRVAQSCKIRLRTHQGEWAWDLAMGIDYRTAVFVKNPNLSRVRAAIALQAAKVDGTRSVKQVELTPDFESRALNAQLYVDTIYGPATEVIA